MSTPPKMRELPASRYNLDTYFGRVRVSYRNLKLANNFLAFDGCDGSAVRNASTNVVDCRTLLTTPSQLEHAKQLVRDYRLGRIPEMNDDLWKAKKSKHPLR